MTAAIACPGASACYQFDAQHGDVETANTYHTVLHYLLDRTQAGSLLVHVFRTFCKLFLLHTIVITHQNNQVCLLELASAKQQDELVCAGSACGHIGGEAV